MNPSSTHLTTLDLDMFDLAAAEPALRVRLESHAARCLTCAARRSERAALAERFRATVFPRTVAAVVARRTSGASIFRRWKWALAVPVGVTLLLAARGLVPRSPSPEGSSPPANAPSAIGIKGDPLLEVFVRHRDGSSPTGSPAIVKVVDGARLYAGDALRFALYPAGLPYALIASVDGAGQVSIYFPFEGEASAPVAGGRMLWAPGSIVLDHAPGPERLFVLYSARPVQAHAVREALARTAAMGGPGIRAARRLPISGTVQATLLFEKDSDPQDPQHLQDLQDLEDRR